MLPPLYYYWIILVSLQIHTFHVFRQPIGQLAPSCSIVMPVVKDRVIQMATKLVIEPIFEANFLSCSYGFRPGVSAHRAIETIQKTITFQWQNVVIDADIVGFFDHIRQDILLKLVQRRISDPRVLKLIKGWLEAGVMDGGEYIEPDGLRTPQGGVISPLRSNIYLHAFDKMFQMSGIPGTLVRY